MAKAASSEQVQADMREPEYRKAVLRLASIQAKKSRAAVIAKEISDTFEAVSAKHNVDKIAAKLFMAVINMDEADRMRTFRDFNGLCDAHGVPETNADMVDMAENKEVSQRLNEGNVVSLPRGRRTKAQKEADAAAALATGPDTDEDGQPINVDPADGDFVGDDEGVSLVMNDEDGFTPVAAEDEEEAAPTPVADADLADAGAEPFTGDNSDLVDGNN